MAILGFLEGMFSFLIVSGIPIAILIWIIRGFIKKINEKERIKSQIIASILVFIISLPGAYVLGGFAMDSPTSTEAKFWQGFFFVESIPILCIVLAFVKLIVQPNTKQRL